MIIIIILQILNRQHICNIIMMKNIFISYKLIEYILMLINVTDS